MQSPGPLNDWAKFRKRKWIPNTVLDIMNCWLMAIHRLEVGRTENLPGCVAKTMKNHGYGVVPGRTSGFPMSNHVWGKSGEVMEMFSERCWSGFGKSFGEVWAEVLAWVWECFWERFWRVFGGWFGNSFGSLSVSFLFLFSQPNQTKSTRRNSTKPNHIKLTKSNQRN